MTSYTSLILQHLQSLLIIFTAIFDALEHLTDDTEANEGTTPAPTV